MSTTPGLVWQNIWAGNASNTSTAFQWSNGGLEPGNPPAVTMPHGDILKAGVLTIGSASTFYPITVLASAGSDSWQLVSGTMSDLRFGMVIVPSIEVAAPAGLPNGLQIVGVNEPTTGSILLGGGVAPALPVQPWVYTQPASQTLEAAANAIDEYPYGYLGVTVTPSTGVTVVDWSFDGTGHDGNVGNGTSMCNSGGQAMGYFGVTFADAGTFTLEVAFTSYDPDYSNTSSSTTVVVS